MKKITMPQSITRNLSKIKFGAVKASPELLLISGAASIIGGTILACKATTKLEEVTEPEREQIADVHNAIENPETVNLKDGETYTEKDATKDLFKLYARSAVKVTKLYLPAIAMTGFGLACMFGSHRILTKRNAALAAAYASVDKAFKGYRGRVVERLGKEMDHELLYDIKTKTFEETEINEKGKEKTVKKNLDCVSGDPTTYSEFARFFDSSSREWIDDREYNLSFLINMQRRANDLLKTNGYLFLNDVYKMLGFQPSKAGQIVGWRYSADDAEIGENQDNEVDFGIFEARREKNRDFVNGYEDVILLDFNVDGNIWDLM